MVVSEVFDVSDFCFMHGFGKLCYMICWYVSDEVYQFCHETFIDRFEGCRDHFKGKCSCLACSSSQILQTVSWSCD